MKEDSKTQRNAGRFEGLEEIQEGLKAQKTAGRFEGPEECRRNYGLKTQLALGLRGLQKSLRFRRLPESLRA